LTLDQAIKEHRETCVVLAVQAGMEGSDGAEIRRQLAEADAKLKAFVESLIPTPDLSADVRKDGSKAEERAARIVHLRDVDELTYPAIGRAFGISSGRAREIYLKQKRILRGIWFREQQEKAKDAPIGTRAPAQRQGCEWQRVEGGWLFSKDGEAWDKLAEKPGTSWTGELILPETATRRHA
jgi:hypothetical protein